MNQGALIVSCPEKQGIIAAITQFLYENGANILHSDQFSTNPESGHFFMRVQFLMDNLTGRIDELRKQFSLIAEPFQMDWKITHPSERKNWRSSFQRKTIVCGNCCGVGVSKN